MLNKLLAWSFMITFSHASLSVEGIPEDYTHKVSENEIDVYVEESSSSEGIKQYYAKVVVDASVDKIVSLFVNDQLFPEWVHQCSFGRVEKGSDDHSFVTYQTYSMPWPVKSREFAWEVGVSREGEGYLLSMRDISDTYFDSKPDNYVRGRIVKGFYRLIPLNGDRTQVIASQKVDPKGNLPSWLVNSMLTDGPLNTLSAMKGILESNQYEKELEKSSDFVETLL